MAKFLGFKQVFKSEFESLSRAEKLNYMWLVRETEDGTASGETISASIYFGSREYANLGGSISGVTSGITPENLSDYVPELIKNPDGTFSLDYESIASHIDYNKIPGLSSVTKELTERVDTVYEAIFPSGSTEDSLVDRVQALEDTVKPMEEYVPITIDTQDDEL